ncbi:MAG: metallophosphoesterase family protein [Nitrospirota bacterium]
MGKINRGHKYIGTLLLIVLTLGSACAAPVQQINRKFTELEKLPQHFNFVVLGDNRSGDDVYRNLISMAMEQKPDFIINTGDQIATPGSREQWANFWELSKVVTVPYFLTVGNHDAHPEVIGSEHTYKEQVDLPGNELYYSFTAGNSLFIVLDSYIGGEEKKITGEQFKWLEGVLADSKEKHKFVFIHHPLYTDNEQRRGKHVGSSLDKFPEDRDRLQALFVKRKVTMVFAGHEHFYLRKTVDGIPHVITGGGGAPLYAKDEDGGFYHYIFVSVDGDKVNAEAVDINGKIRDKF